jgi:hypothetical protein
VRQLLRGGERETSSAVMSAVSSSLYRPWEGRLLELVFNLLADTFELFVQHLYFIRHGALCCIVRVMLVTPSRMYRLHALKMVVQDENTSRPGLQFFSCFSPGPPVFCSRNNAACRWIGKRWCGRNCALQMLPMSPYLPLNTAFQHYACTTTAHSPVPLPDCTTQILDPQPPLGLLPPCPCGARSNYCLTVSNIFSLFFLQKKRKKKQDRECWK